MTSDKPMNGHLAACITILIWGTTFISTKVLLSVFTPIEILFIRFIIGYLALWCIFPHRLTLKSSGENLYFAAAGLCGVTLYYLLENIALTFTLASNVGVIISVAPFFTAIFSTLFLKEGKTGKHFYMGFLMAIAGVCLISFPQGSGLSFHPAGDLLAILAAVVWAVYSTLTKKISTFGYDAVPVTRRTFFFGLLFMLPFLCIMDFKISPADILHPQNALNLLFLGLGASALCFVTWNLAVRILGSVRTSVYIYMVPVITSATSVLILHEHITKTALAGILLTLAGLFYSLKKERRTFSANTRQQMKRE